MSDSEKLTQAEIGKLLELGRAVLENESCAVAALTRRLDEKFAHACELILASKGRVIVTGMGKSGHIGSKIAATLASTGTPAFFVHPGEASHGDLGMFTSDDVVIALSNSGETDELLALLPILKLLDIPLISMTGKPSSSLASFASVNLDVGVEQEACPLNLAPTSSTTAALAMGDALAVSLLEHRGFTAEDFARSHPGGSLGRRLLLMIDDVMRKDGDIPRTPLGAPLREALLEMSRKGLGMTAIVNGDDQLEGVFTDGDLRRILDDDADIHGLSVDDVMTRGCKSMTADKLAAEALQVMEEYRISALPVVDANNKLIGALNMHDLLRAGLL